MEGSAANAGSQGYFDNHRGSPTGEYGHWLLIRPSGLSSFLGACGIIVSDSPVESECTVSKMNVTAVFGGIGGIELGLHKAGHATSLFCESDPEAVSVLAARFPKVPIKLDIRRTGELVEAISPGSNLLTAGFPCTDLSQAGATRGFAGGRSSLIRETIEVLRKRTSIAGSLGLRLPARNRNICTA
jgi:hypothetical protein